jgi:hypothetical protein
VVKKEPLLLVFMVTKEEENLLMVSKIKKKGKSVFAMG